MKGGKLKLIKIKGV